MSDINTKHGQAGFYHSIAFKLILAVMIPVLTCISALWFYSDNEQNIRASNEDARNVRIQINSRIAKMQKQLYEIESISLKYQSLHNSLNAEKNDEFNQKYRSLWESNGIELKNLDQIFEKLKIKKLTKLAEEYRKYLQDYVVTCGEIFSYPSRSLPEKMSLQREILIKILERLTAETDSFENSQLEALRIQESTEQNRVLRVTAIVLIIALALSAVLSKMIVSRINALKLACTELLGDRPDLSKSVDISGKDEISKLSVILNEYIQKLAEEMRSNTGSARNLARIAKQLESVASRHKVAFQKLQKQYALEQMTIDKIQSLVLGIKSTEASPLHSLQLEFLESARNFILSNKDQKKNEELISLSKVLHKIIESPFEIAEIAIKIQELNEYISQSNKATTEVGELSKIINQETVALSMEADHLRDQISEIKTESQEEKTDDIAIAPQSDVPKEESADSLEGPQDNSDEAA